MKLQEFLLYELTDLSNARKEFWADEFGNLMLDIDDMEDVMDYIKKKSDKLTKDYSHKIDGRKACDLTKDEIVKKMGWYDILLNGKKDKIKFKSYRRDDEKIPEKDIDTTFYIHATIYSPLKHNNKSDKDDNLKELIKKIKTIFPSINQIRSIDRDKCVKEFLL